MYSYYNLKVNTYETMKSMITELRLPTNRLGCLHNNTLIVGDFKRPQRKQLTITPQCQLSVDVQKQAKLVLHKFMFDLELSSLNQTGSFTLQLVENIRKEMELDPICCTALC